MVISGKAIKRSSDFTSEILKTKVWQRRAASEQRGKSPRHTSTPVQYVRRPDSVCGTSPSEMIHHRCAKWFKKPLPLPRMNNDAVLQKHYFIRIQFESIPSRVVDDSSAPLSTFPECFSNTASFPLFTQPTPARDPRTVGKSGHHESWYWFFSTFSFFHGTRRESRTERKSSSIWNLLFTCDIELDFAQ